jgi:type I restriction enzyme S subunit
MIPMKQTPLSQLASVSAGQGAPKDNEFSESGTPFVRAGSLEPLLSGKSESELELVSADTAKLRKLKTYPKGTILFAKSGMSATKDRVYVLQNPAHVVSHLATLIPKDGVHGDYLRLALKRFPPSSLIKDPAYPSIGLGEIENFEIPVPDDLDDQIRIAHLLVKVEGLIAQRKRHLQQFNDLLKSVFLEMFGDPVRNERGWNKKLFSDLLADIDSGKSPKCEARAAAADEWGVLKLGAVTRCNFNERENKALPSDVSPSVRDEVRAGDLLFSRKNTYELVAACAYVFDTRPKLLMPDLIFRFVFKPEAEVNPIFMWKLLTNDSQRKTIQSLAGGAAGSMPNISKANLKAVRLSIPPLSLQNQFASIVEKVETLKIRYQQSLVDLEILYGALNQESFRGDLDLSRVPMPNTPPPDATAAASAVFEEQTAAAVIELPDTNLLLRTLQDRAQLEPLLQHWLEAYRGQLRGSAFSTEQFVAAAQARIAELHPDDDFAFNAKDYEHIKDWVFEALNSGRLQQSRNISGRDENGQAVFGNAIELKVAQA